MYPTILGTSLISDLVGGSVSEGLQWILNNTIFRLLYWIAAAGCWVIGILYSMFEVMAGLVKVTYDGEKQYLINIFFGNSAVNKVYWGIALIGFVLCFAFTIIAVIRKMFDMEGKMQNSLGQIIGSGVKSIILIGLMSAFMLAMLNMTNILIQQVMYIFNNSEDLGKEQTITYTDEEYAAMARVLNTIGNYSLNPAWTSRYNINSCFNDFREDLQWLYEQGVFDVYYDDTVIKHTSWQSELEKIVYTVDLSEELPLNIYNENLQAALEHVVEVMETDKKFKPISSYERTTTTGSESVPLDRILFLACTMRAANNSAFNENASFTDALRAPYYTGAKSIYDYDTVIQDFDIGLSTDYILLFLIGFIMVKDLMEIIFTCVSRIFNMILLYLISPPLIAASPLDGGAKFKQWITAMVVQSFGVFGTIISMRIMMLLIPIMLGGDLVLFDNVFLNIFGKIILIVGAIEVEKKAQGLITGILADNAGLQAVNAGDMKETAGNFMSGMGSLGLGATKLAGKTGLLGAKGAFYGGKYAAKGAYQGGKYAAKGAYYGGKYAGKGIMAAGSAIGSGASWIGSKVGNMFSKDTGGKNRANTEGIEMQDLSNSKPGPEKAPAMESEQSQQPKQEKQENLQGTGGDAGGGAAGGTGTTGTTEPQKQSWGSWLSSKFSGMFSRDTGSTKPPVPQEIEMQDLSATSQQPEKAPDIQSEQSQQSMQGEGNNQISEATKAAMNNIKQGFDPLSGEVKVGKFSPSSGGGASVSGGSVAGGGTGSQPKSVQQTAGGTKSSSVGGGTKVSSAAGGTKSSSVAGGTKSSSVAGGTNTSSIAGGTNTQPKSTSTSSMVKPVKAPTTAANSEVVNNVRNGRDPLSGRMMGGKSVQSSGGTSISGGGTVSGGGTSVSGGSVSGGGTSVSGGTVSGGSTSVSGGTVSGTSTSQPKSVQTSATSEQSSSGGGGSTYASGGSVVGSGGGTTYASSSPVGGGTTYASGGSVGGTGGGTTYASSGTVSGGTSFVSNDSVGGVVDSGSTYASGSPVGGGTSYVSSGPVGGSGGNSVAFEEGNNPQVQYSAGTYSTAQTVKAPTTQANSDVVNNFRSGLDPLSGQPVSRSARPSKVPPIKNKK